MLCQCWADIVDCSECHKAKDSPADTPAAVSLSLNQINSKCSDRLTVFFPNALKISWKALRIYFLSLSCSLLKFIAALSINVFKVDKKHFCYYYYFARKAEWRWNHMEKYFLSKNIVFVLVMIPYFLFVVEPWKFEYLALKILEFHILFSVLTMWYLHQWAGMQIIHKIHVIICPHVLF